MAQRRIILALVVFSSLAVFAVQTLSQARGSNPRKPPDLERLQNMTEQERKRYFEKMRTQPELERAQKKRELAKERAQKERELAKEGRGQLISIQQRRKNSREKIAEITKELLREKAALGATEEQWKLIKPKLEKVRQLRAQGRQGSSMVGMFLAGVSSSSGTSPTAGARQNVPTWQWKRSWRDKPLSELTEAQKLTKQLIALVERKSTSPEQFRRTINALRKARSKEAELERQLSEAREELREGLTPRQEAALVLMRWL